MTPRRVLVTRPVREALRWAQALRQRGVDAHALPLLGIEPLADDSALREVRARAGRFDAWMFVSAAAVEHFLEDGMQGPEGPRCWGTGPGTASALRAAGIPEARIDVPGPSAGQFDSEALWQIVRPQVRPGSRVLFVRGGDASGEPAGRDWLSRQVADAGAQDGTVWLFGSSQAIANLCTLLPAADWSGALAVATHPRIAQSATAAGFGRVATALGRLDELVASIESFQ